MKFIELHIDGREVLINSDQIVMISSKKRAVLIHTATRTIEVQESLKKIKNKIEDSKKELLAINREKSYDSFFKTIRGLQDSRPNPEDDALCSCGSQKSSWFEKPCQKKVRQKQIGRYFSAIGYSNSCSQNSFSAPCPEGN